MRQRPRTRRRLAAVAAVTADAVALLLIVLALVKGVGDAEVSSADATRASRNVMRTVNPFPSGIFA